MISTLRRPSLREIRAKKMQRDLRLYVANAWHVVEPGTTYKSNWHIDAICDHLQAVSRGEITKLIINIPPRHMKSLTTAVMWPTWDWVSTPHRKFLFSSYAMTLSIRDSIKCRRLIQSPWYQRRWGDRFTLMGDQNAKQRYDNSATGYRLATSVGGALTGDGGDIIVIDDAHNAVEGESELKRTGALEWWDNSMSTRLNDPKNGAYVIVMQRLHENDLVGHILAKEHGWDHLCLPARYEPEHPHPVSSSLGFVDPRTEEGELLWPERVGETEMVSLETRLGRYNAAGQLQQRPAPSGGGIFQRKWFRYHEDGGRGDHYILHRPESEPRRVLKSLCWRFVTSDQALTEKTTGDYSVIGVWDLTPEGDLILVHLWRDQVEAPEVDAELRKAIQRWRPTFLGVEKKHYGQAIVQRFLRDGLAVRALEANTDKINRATTVAVMMENGKVYFPAEAEWLAEFERELELFPNAAHDDQVDVLSYAGLAASNREMWMPIIHAYRNLSAEDGGHVTVVGGAPPKPGALPADWPLWIYLSIGTHPAALLLTVDPDEMRHVVDEIYQPGATPGQMSELIKEKLAAWERDVEQLRGLRIDPRADKVGRANMISLSQQYHDRGLPVYGWMPASTVGDQALIDLLNEQFLDNGLWVSDRCRQLRVELSTWRLKPDPESRGHSRHREETTQYEGPDYALRCLMAWLAEDPRYEPPSMKIVDTADF